ncbi:hypothetical protein [Amycolatopsis sp. WQ 127309]|uniref:hypothetical protein n=1 Tax=Amycolatopsis sp. WQ 127309 TaxID=2932773 RepID=UPI001FF49393|nr:hypothetical protein [Amycolatopsis sp. WQ 127309]UOZ06975.1 hypothetical protein MUY22_01380 [Amycolatopsis sp. WQ 127309]
MTDDRRVRLEAAARAVSVSGATGHEVVRYEGITVTRVEGGEPVGQTWIPVGEDPTYADDEALIAAWRTALSWSSCFDVP